MNQCLVRGGDHRNQLFSPESLSTTAKINIITFYRLILKRTEKFAKVNMYLYIFNQIVLWLDNLSSYSYVYVYFFICSFTSLVNSCLVRKIFLPIRRPWN